MNIDNNTDNVVDSLENSLRDSLEVVGNSDLLDDKLNVSAVSDDEQDDVEQDFEGDVEQDFEGESSEEESTEVFTEEESTEIVSFPAVVESSFDKDYYYEKGIKVARTLKYGANSAYQKALEIYRDHTQELGLSITTHFVEMFKKVLSFFWLFLGSLLHAVFPFMAGKFCYTNNTKNLSDYEKVLKFTKAAGTNCSQVPTLIGRERGKFLIEMVMSELHEFVLTLDGIKSGEEGYEFMRECIGTDPHEYEKRSNLERIAEQGDAMVDAWVYMNNVAAEHGIDLSRIFTVVMDSNMAKIDPSTGMCNRRESDGKILKPEGWAPPDIVSEIYKQSRGE